MSAKKTDVYAAVCHRLLREAAVTGAGLAAHVEKTSNGMVATVYDPADGDKVEIGHSRPDEGIVGVDAISGATVTVIAQNQVLMTSAANVARQTGILPPVQRPVDNVHVLKRMDLGLKITRDE